VILALCSQNNEAGVFEVLRTHPDIVLREENFATWQINWDDKVTNLKRIAHDLNIGLDTVVFVDDSQFECDLVREQLPEVAVLQLSSDPSSFPRKLRSMGYFDTLVLAAEDRERNRMYRDQAKRKHFCVSTRSLDEYLAKLEMVVEIGLANEMNIPRISQLTQKTNQFNLTTQRYTEGDIRTFTESSEADVFYLRLRDRISEMGLVGVAIAKYNGGQAEIDTFLLSCRAIGRGVERAQLVHVLNCARVRGCTHVLGRYLMTEKNGQVADFYSGHDFYLMAQNAKGSEWKISLKGNVFAAPGFLKVDLV
jgi:FkbH-like protein